MPRSEEEERIISSYRTEKEVAESKPALTETQIAAQRLRELSQHREEDPPIYNLGDLFAYWWWILRGRPPKE